MVELFLGGADSDKLDSILPDMLTPVLPAPKKEDLTLFTDGSTSTAMRDNSSGFAAIPHPRGSKPRPDVRT